MIGIDKIFEIDFGFDYSDDDRYTLEELLKELSKENKAALGFWSSLIKEDITDSFSKPVEPSKPISRKTQW